MKINYWKENLKDLTQTWVINPEDQKSLIQIDRPIRDVILTPLEEIFGKEIFAKIYLFRPKSNLHQLLKDQLERLQKDKFRVSEVLD